MPQPPQPLSLTEIVLSVVTQMIAAVLADRSPIDHWGFALVEDHEVGILDYWAIQWAVTCLYTECLDTDVAKGVQEVLAELGFEQINDPHPTGTAIVLFKRRDDLDR